MYGQQQQKGFLKVGLSRNDTRIELRSQQVVVTLDLLPNMPVKSKMRSKPLLGALLFSLNSINLKFNSYLSLLQDDDMFKPFFNTEHI